MKRNEASHDKERDRMMDQMLRRMSRQSSEKPSDPAEVARRAVRDSRIPKKEGSKAKEHA